MYSPEELLVKNYSEVFDGGRGKYLNAIDVNCYVQFGSLPGEDDKLGLGACEFQFHRLTPFDEDEAGVLEVSLNGVANETCLC